MSPAKTQPALIAGVAIGVLSALPVISIANLCCCAWVLFGGGLAAYLMQQNHPEPISVGDGMIGGLMAGVLGAFVGGILSVLLSYAMGPFQAEMARVALSNPDLPPEFRRVIEQFGTGTVLGLGFVIAFIASLIVFALFGTLGGLFGALLFKKTAPVTPPPIPPPGF